MSRSGKKRPRVLTYRDLREAAAFFLSATAILGTLAVGAGLLASPGILAGALALVLAGSGCSAWLRGLSDMDSAAAEWIARARPALILSVLGGITLLLAPLLLVPLSGWSAWLAAALPLLFAILVRSAFLVSETDYAVLAGLSLLAGAWLLAFPGWAPRAAFLAIALLAIALLVSGRLWTRHRQGILKGKVAWGEWLPLFAAPAAGAAALLMLVFVAAPTMDPLWNPARRRPAGRMPKIVVEWHDTPERHGGDPARRPDGGNGGETPVQQDPAGAEATPPDTVVIRPPSGGNLAAFLKSAFSLVSRRGLHAGLWVLAVLPLVWLTRRILKMKRSLAGIAEEKLKEVLEGARRRRREKEPPPPVPEDPREAVVHLYNGLRNEFDRHGYKRQAHLAPREYAKYLSFRIDDQKEPIERVTGLFETALYSQGALVGAERREMMSLCERLRRRVQTGSPTPAPA